MKTYVCQVCSYVAFDEAPVDCPVCESAIENFENKDDAVKRPADPASLNEMERKHIPKIYIKKSCGQGHDSECANVSISVGEIEHLMESEHFINVIDLYLNKKYLTRIIFTPLRIRPSIELHLNVNKGKLTAVSSCSVHGKWVSEAVIENIL